MRKTTSDLTQFLFLLLSFSSLAAQDLSDPNYLCDANEGNFTAKETYGTTLSNLLGTIPTTTSSTLTYGLFNASAIRPQDPDNIEAYGVCGGDLTRDACVDCLKNSSKQIRQICPIEKSATLFEAKCWIRYSDKHIYGVVNMDPYLPWYDGQIASNWGKFVTVLKDLLATLRDEAASGGPIRKYATGNSTDDLYTLYGMVQCSPDLSSQYCSNCLDYITGLIPDNWTGGGVWTPSCRVKYSTIRFFGPIAVSLSTPTTTPPSIQSGESKSSTKWIIIAVACGFAIFVIANVVVIALFIARRNKRILDRSTTEDRDDISMADSLQFNLDVIRSATENFSDSNKLGQGGFGPVFRGKLSNGQEIAVKRLSENSGQGESELKNEVLLLLRLQHRNLVRLLGYCFEGVERLLVYEFVPNTSLDKFIFDPLKRALLDWDCRYKIILGIARGLLYLHEDSRHRIIHRDLKASNILLDSDMNPKVSDFGMARLFDLDQTRADTSKVAGTYGYMAPEYVMHGRISQKTDVFSFGVLALEIVSGRRNIACQGEEDLDILTSDVWMNWREGTISNIVDPLMNSGCRADIVRCIHIGLLCVQENVADRPTMASVILMLNSHSITLSVPTQPAFLMNGSSLNGSNMGTQSINEASITDPYAR